MNQPAPEPTFLGRFSDEELVLLDAEHGLVNLPQYNAMNRRQQDRALAGGLRMLQAREGGLDIDAGTVDLPQHQCDLFDFRSGASCVLMMQILRPEPGGEVGLVHDHYAFVDDDFVLLEDVDVEGMHDYWALHLHELVGALQARIPEQLDGQDGAGEPVTVDLSAVAAGQSTATIDLVGRALIQIDATVWRAPATPDPVLCSVVVGDRGTYATVAIDGARGPITMVPISRTRLGQEVVRLLDPDRHDSDSVTLTPAP